MLFAPPARPILGFRLDIGFTFILKLIEIKLKSIDIIHISFYCVLAFTLQKEIVKFNFFQQQGL